MTIEIINKQEEKKEEKRLPYRPPDSAFTKLVNDKHVLYCPRCRTLARFISSDVCLNCFHWDYSARAKTVLLRCIRSSPSSGLSVLLY